MIRINRGPEPTTLLGIRDSQLKILRNLGRAPTSNDVEGYRAVAEELWTSQYHKCCYCEARIPRGYNDVEHYRPKAEADRSPGCTSTHGYWWLAFNWDNLLFACPACNRSNKNSKFPLEVGCQSLIPEDKSPGNESPLLLDPGSSTNPVEHIEFSYIRAGSAKSSLSWWAKPRNGSHRGKVTIDVCGLNRDDLREIRDDHYATVILPHSFEILDAIQQSDATRLKKEYTRALGLLTPRNVHVGLTYDALSHLVPSQRLISLIGLGWPAPNVVAL